MKDIIKQILSLIGNNISFRILKKQNSSTTNGNGNKTNQANRDINNINLIFLPQYDNIDIKHRETFKHETDIMIQKLNQEFNIADLKNILTDFSNYRTFGIAITQIATYPNDAERKEILRKLLLEKFKNNDNKDRLAQQGISEMENLSLRDLKILAVISFIMTLSRHLRENTIISNKKNLITLIEEVGTLENIEIEKLRAQGILYHLFPQKYNIMGLDCLKNVDAELYDYCLQWIKSNEYICEFKLAPLGYLLSKTLFSAIYNLDYENIVNDILPVKKIDLDVGNIVANGNLVASGAITFGTSCQ